MPIFKQNTRFERGIDLAGPSKGEYIAKNWHTAQTITDLGSVGFYQQTAQTWFTFGTNGTTTPYAMSADGSDWYYRGAIGGFQGVCALRDSHATGPEYVTVAGGLSPGGTAYKIKRSPDLGTTWEDILIGVADTSFVTAMAFASFGYLARIGNDIHWSLTGDSGSYNLMLTMSNPSSPNNLCTNNGNLVVAYAQTGSTYYTTTTGSSWSTRTFPNSFVVTSMAYGKVGGSLVNGFLAIGSDATGPAAYYSFSGTSWSLMHRFASGTQFGSLAAMNEVFIGMIISAEAGGGSNVLYSPDGGTTWKPATTVANYFGTHIEVATRPGESPHQAGIFQDNLTKMTIVG
jgi:hypothetical protein